jgi:hypothetical protein
LRIDPEQRAVKGKSRKSSTFTFPPEESIDWLRLEFSSQQEIHFRRLLARLTRLKDDPSFEEIEDAWFDSIGRALDTILARRGRDR